MTVIPAEVKKKIRTLFYEGLTVREISNVVNVSNEDILFYLTKKGLWSTHCSECNLKRCYDCPGLQELGRPLNAQDKVSLKVELRDL